MGVHPPLVEPDGMPGSVRHRDVGSVARGNRVTELNASDGSVVPTISGFNAPQGISSDGTHVLVTNNNANTVTNLSIQQVPSCAAGRGTGQVWRQQQPPYRRCL